VDSLPKTAAQMQDGSKVMVCCGEAGIGSDGRAIAAFGGVQPARMLMPKRALKLFLPRHL
jgi:hypothetical protein